MQKNTFGTNNGDAIFMTKRLATPDDPQDRIGMLNCHSLPFYQQLEHKSIELPFQECIVDERPRRNKMNRRVIFGKTMWYLQTVMLFIVMGGGIVTYRGFTDYTGHNQKIYPVTQQDRSSTMPELRWLFGLWQQSDLEYKS